MVEADVVEVTEYFKTISLGDDRDISAGAGLGAAQFLVNQTVNRHHLGVRARLELNRARLE